jgi:hypothetical protein
VTNLRSASAVSAARRTRRSSLLSLSVATIAQTDGRRALEVNPGVAAGEALIQRFRDAGAASGNVCLVVCLGNGLRLVGGMRHALYVTGGRGRSRGRGAPWGSLEVPGAIQPASLIPAPPVPLRCVENPGGCQGFSTPVARTTHDVENQREPRGFSTFGEANGTRTDTAPWLLLFKAQICENDSLSMTALPTDHEATRRRSGDAVPSSRPVASGKAPSGQGRRRC